MIRNKIRELLKRKYPDQTILIDYVPKNKEGDYSTNLAFKIASQENKNPLEIANNIANHVTDPIISKITVHSPGFVNFHIDPGYMKKCLFDKDLIPENIGQGKKILVEFVSANPTGPINVVSARAAAIGNTLVKLLNITGYNAEAEYYINDAGRQAVLLAESVQQRLIELEGGQPQIPKNGYHGEYIKEVAKKIKEKKISGKTTIQEFSLSFFIDKHRRVLDRFGVNFDNWIRETKIHNKQYVDKVLSLLKEKKLAYEKDDALWFKATDFGDIDDRVIVTSDGRYTYLLSDMAYHMDKFERGYDILIDIWGPDHHGRIKGLIGGMQALNYPREAMKIIIAQEVKLKKGGEYLTMSKRAGTFEKLDELLDQIPVDVVRFFLLMRSNSQHLDFDYDLAIEESDENPVYYVQYAHARIQSIIKKARDKGSPLTDDFDISLIQEIYSIALIKKILRFPELIEDAARNFEPYMLTYYLIELARTFHLFYQKVRVLTDKKELTSARLALINKTAETLKQGLGLLGISCPEQM